MIHLFTSLIYMINKVANPYTYTDIVIGNIKSYRKFGSTSYKEGQIYKHIDYSLLKHIFKNHLTINQKILSAITYSVIYENDIINLSNDEISSGKALQNLSTSNYSLVKKLKDMFNCQQPLLIEFIDNNKYHIGFMLKNTCYILDMKNKDYKIDDLSEELLEKVIFKYYDLISNNEINNNKQIIEKIKEKCIDKFKYMIYNDDYLSIYYKSIDKIEGRKEIVSEKRRVVISVFKNRIERRNFDSEMKGLLLSYFKKLFDSEYKFYETKKLDNAINFLEKEKGEINTQIDKIKNEDKIKKTYLVDHKARNKFMNNLKRDIKINCDRNEIYKQVEKYTYDEKELENFIDKIIKLMEYHFNTHIFKLSGSLFNNKKLWEIDSLIKIVYNIHNSIMNMTQFEER